MFFHSRVGKLDGKSITIAGIFRKRVIGQMAWLASYPNPYFKEK
jgi:hypothetical protein